MNKVSRVIINTLVSGEKRRHVVTAKIRNYPRADREAGIKYVLEEGLVVARYDKPGSLGRTAVLLSLTKKGKRAADSLDDAIDEKSVWSI